ncbi:MAG: hypothetical protein ABIN89_09930, partial [Chitinophagaceae bacterium]
MKKTLSLLLIFFLMVISFDISASIILKKSYRGWKAGVAKINITPDRYIWMGGYASRNHPAEGKVTDLWAKALALED